MKNEIQELDCLSSLEMITINGGNEATEGFFYFLGYVCSALKGGAPGYPCVGQ